MKQVLEEQQRSEFEVEEVPLRIWEQVTNQIRQEIVSLQNQLWQSNIDKVFQKGNGVPKILQKKLRMMKMGKSNRQCSICCNSFEKDETIIQLPCKHIFHKSCLFSWLDHSTKCPNCRSDVLDLLMSQER
ncbi:unnamed protein product (macronuclear) [Paramecium tetraurelia]|uniref:RING-type domain-containing protein n=1 Tax=Paramecium tetraurelia TaxID=5888 RepID=A0CG72_PARTE|nr:uncharacterized protein GSPATT00038234001 [Paramecium tetraurelia]CAK69789.1 unnamed protein product [Paramecium tetraurelia]|eukprot:XP_001437186.1 hypothetical protein (macronuclear) [Paramecium tetraurelia strain d4-2]